MIKINLVCNLIGASGYANHSKGFFNSLCKVADVKLETPLVQGWEALVNDEELKSIKKEWHKDGITYCIGMPHTWNTYMLEPCKKFVGCLVWEGDKIPVGFKENLEKADQIIVPSCHVMTALQNSFPELLNKTRIVPHGVNTLNFQPVTKQDSRFVFLANKGLGPSGKNDRGGLYYLLKAYSEEFKKGENVILKIKLNMSYAQGFNPMEMINSWALCKDHAEIMINTDFVNSSDLPKLYEADVFVSPSMAEAFSLPCLEAMSCGIPVITTSFGGQKDFVNNGNGLMVSGTLKEVTHDVLYEGVKWLDPNVLELREKMRYLFNNPEIVKTKGIMARKQAENFSWDKSVELFMEIVR
jgi:glycosyltransferase involved in cell wall biosynthesis